MREVTLLMVWRGRAQWKDQQPSKENKAKGLETMSDGWNTCATSGWIDPHNTYPAAPFVFVKIINSIIFFIVIITSLGDGTEISGNCSSELLKEGYRSHCSPLSVTHRPHHYSWPVNDLLSQDAACLRSCPHKRLGECTNTSATWEMWPWQPQSEVEESLSRRPRRPWK